MAEQSRTIEAARVTCKIIDLLRERGTAGITEIAEALDRSKSSIHAYLTTLVEEKYVVKEDGQYSLSLRYLDLAEHVKNQVGEYDVIRSEIDKLAETTNEVAQFATLERSDLVYLYKARGESGVETMSSIGSRESLHSTSLGKALLSQLSEERVRELVGPGPLPRKTENTITDMDAFFTELEQTRERGYAIDDEENIVGLRCVAAPVVLDDGTVIGALSVTGPSSRMTTDRIESELEDEVKRAANVIQINTKFSEHRTPSNRMSRGVVADFQGQATEVDRTAEGTADRGPPLHETESADVLEREWCPIRPVHSEKALDIHAGSTADGATVEQWNWNDGDMQRFQITHLEGGIYRIDADHTGKPIEVESASTTTGAPIQQNSWADEDHQKWRIQQVSDDAFRIVNVNSGKVLDVAGESVEDGVTIVQWDWLGGENQKFRF